MPTRPLPPALTGADLTVDAQFEAQSNSIYQIQTCDMHVYLTCASASPFPPALAAVE
eukprot:IDg2073t1